MCQCKFVTYIWPSYFLKCFSEFSFPTDVTVFFLQRNRAMQKIKIYELLVIRLTERQLQRQ